MGKYLNPNNNSYNKFYNGRIKNDRVFVDKSLVIEKINCLFNGEDKYLCVSRPRRFGKTLIMSLLVAFYSKGCDSRPLFENLKIAQTPNWDKKLNKYNVINLDIKSIYGDVENYNLDLKDTLNQYVLNEMILEFPDIDFDGIINIKKAIQRIYDKTKEQFIIIIDEYDYLIRKKVSKLLIDEYLEFLSDLFKSGDTEDEVALAYLTGILPIINNDKVQSNLSVFDEYSVVKPKLLAGYIGFTEDEVKEVCIKHNMKFKEMKSWYNGYNIGGITVYNSNSISEAVKDGFCSNNWGSTGSFEVITDYIIEYKDNDNKKETENKNENKSEEDIIDEITALIAGGKISTPISSNRKILNFSLKESVYTYLIHIGYLTYNYKTHECYIPNKELFLEWSNALYTSESESIKPLREIYEHSIDLLNYTANKNSSEVIRLLNYFYKKYFTFITYDKENSFKTSLAIFYGFGIDVRENYLPIKEFPSNQKRIDFLLLPVSNRDTAIIIELKYEKCEEEAVEQIKERNYGIDLTPYKKNMVIVGLNYNKDAENDEDRFECTIEDYKD